MKFGSTRGGVRGVSLEEAILSGYAPDGGLYVPESLPQLSAAQLQAWASLSYPQLVEELLKLFASPEDLTHQEIHGALSGCFSVFFNRDVLSVATVGQLHVAELWHGPTGSFKDLPVTVIARLAEHFLAKRGKKATFVVGTAGNTGSAVLCSVVGSKHLSAAVLYPRGRITRLQELQMTTVSAPNVRVYSSDGSPDNLDAALKGLFANVEFSQRCTLVGLNSINLGRVLLHIAHFIYAYLRLCPKVDKEVTFSIPSGGLGNAAGGYMAYLMGLPVRLLVAVNDNNITHRVFSTGVFKPSSKVLQTYATGMDTQLPPNMERLFYFMSGGDCEMVRAVMEELEEKGSCNVPDRLLQGNKCVATTTVSNEDILSTIQQVWREFRYPLCPHSAIAVRAALDHLQSRGGSKEAEDGGQDEETVIVLATATPAKFPEVLEKAGVPVPTHPALSGLHDKPEAKLYLEAGDDWEEVLKRDVEQLQLQ